MVGEMREPLTDARDWLACDPDPRDRAELRTLIDRAEAGDLDALGDLDGRFDSELTFGTAGLRAPMGAGRARLNTATIIRATRGLVSVLTEDSGGEPLVVVGYDGRHRSTDFARTVAGVVTAAGGRALLMPRMLPTPLLVYATRALGAEAGVMITASHNPASDNGYKVYLGGRMVDAIHAGMQIIPPMDARIASAIAASPPADQIPCAAEGWGTVDEAVVTGYLKAAHKLTRTWLNLAADATRLGDGHGPIEWADVAQIEHLRVVLTAMHGVGTEVCQAALTRLGVRQLFGVNEQALPDPDFPTVAFPNPEEPGALDCALGRARQVSADLVVALDPDADRCAVAYAEAGDWRVLSGDELGAILGEFCCSLHPGRVVSRSLPTSSQIDLIAAEYGLTCAETLGGFKWIARVPGLVYGCEEAIGYCLNPTVVPDKDGITAALATVVVAGLLRAQDLGLGAILDELACRHGLVYTTPLTFRMAGQAQIDAALARFAAYSPATLAGSPVVSCHDLTEGYRGLGPTPGYRLASARHDRVIIRPSGTEPKLKCYLEVVEDVRGRTDLAAARQRAAARIAQICDQMRQVLLADEQALLDN